jgi:HK97 family phage major capsid protein
VKTYIDRWQEERANRRSRKCSFRDDDAGGGGGAAVAEPEAKKERARRVVIEVVRDAFGSQLDELEKTKNELAAMKAQLEAMRTTGTTAIGVPGLDDELKKHPFSFARAIYAQLCTSYGQRNAWDKFAGYENDVIQEGIRAAGDYAEARLEKMQSRTLMVVGDDSLGGFWVPEQVAQQFFIEVLVPSTALFKLPISRLTGLTANPVSIPKETGDLTCYWVGEEEAITESNLGAGQLRFRPHELGALVKLSAKLLREASFGVEQFVRQRIANRFARSIDLAAFKGTGSSNQPLGLLNWGIQSQAASADPPTTISTYADLNNIIGKLEQANVPDANDWSWVFHAKAKGKFRSFMTGDGSNSAALPFWTQDPTIKGLANNLLGYPHVLMNQLATNLGGATDESEIILGAWSNFLFLQWAGFELAVSAETSDAFAKRQVWVRAIQEVDCGPMQEDAFVLMNDYQVA